MTSIKELVQYFICRIRLSSVITYIATKKLVFALNLPSVMNGLDMVSRTMIVFGKGICVKKDKVIY